mmetsp:Transcript_30654/g.93795  ORF Transcript_30654/g.93795 Transcript_30654/m.93795 type:complete len:532 (-) Transcript_30654:238-1833(-)
MLMLLLLLALYPAAHAAHTSSAPVVLSVAGSDSGGGAGIQADLKTCEALGVFGTTAIVALTAQNTLGVHGVHPVPVDFVRAQMDAVLGDMGAHVVKTGMLPSAEVIHEVASALKVHNVSVRVIDPVIIAASGDVLAGPEAVATIRNVLIPGATVVTPNMPEAGALLGRAVPTSVAEMRQAALDLLALGPQAVLLKGGRLPEGEGMVDVFVDAEHGIVELRYDRIDTSNTHGAGCTLAAAVAAELSKQVHVGTVVEPLAAVRAARSYVATVFDSSSGIRIGTGLRGPLNHARAKWQQEPKIKSPSRQLWEDPEVTKITAKCLSNGFVVALADGTLPRETFGGYVAQDKFFLEAFAQAYTLAITKLEAHDASSARDLAALVRGVVEELQMHTAYAKEWGVDVHQVTPTPACKDYVDFLLNVARSTDNGIAACIATMIPCMRLYAYLGQTLAANASAAGNRRLNPYDHWISTYADDGFEGLAATLEALFDRHVSRADGPSFHRLRELYVRAMELELAFFDGWNPRQQSLAHEEL